ncbi:hypothetical protein [Lysobacter enzymogenes]|uniref:hypothetical protein n=1 Tax=Lysobacter enzymogenes TaxID=69 RepID=UPI00374A2509
MCYAPLGGRIQGGSVTMDDMMSLTVEYSDPGIPEHPLDRVFDRFHRELGAGIDGSGLGVGDRTRDRLQARSPGRTGQIRRVRWAAGASSRTARSRHLHKCMTAYPSRIFSSLGWALGPITSNVLQRCRLRENRRG